jgi:two-component system LytT family response regulator
MIRVVVVDDEPLARRGVQVRLAAHADVALVGEYGDGAAAAAGIAADRPDLVFIDVQMPGMNGLEVLASLPAARRPLAILLTAYESFAVRAFELQAIDYLLKPIADDRFAEALDRARQAYAQRCRASTAGSDSPADGDAARPTYPARFAVRVGRWVAFVNAVDVTWIAADGDYATLYCGDSKYLLRQSLNQLSRELDPAQFIRVHRSTIVRLDHVAELRPLPNRDALLRLRDGALVRASRTYIEPLCERLRGRDGAVPG